jgi:hypothetical protein
VIYRCTLDDSSGSYARAQALLQMFGDGTTVSLSSTDPRLAGQLVTDLLLMGVPGKGDVINRSDADQAANNSTQSAQAATSLMNWGFPIVTAGYQLCVNCTTWVRPPENLGRLAPVLAPTNAGTQNSTGKGANGSTNPGANTAGNTNAGVNTNTGVNTKTSTAANVSNPTQPPVFDFSPGVGGPISNPIISPFGDVTTSSASQTLTGGEGAPNNGPLAAQDLVGTAAVPEPGTWALMTIGLALAGSLRFTRSRRLRDRQ